MAWRFGIASDVGGRKTQQDRVAVLETPASDDRLVVLADGMGGYRGGELAAQAVIDCARHAFETASVKDPLVFLEQLCARAHQAVQDIAPGEGQAPGSTCVLLYLSANEAHWVHVGDSRLYHLRKGKLLARTADHSVVQLLVAQGKIAEADVATSPLQNQLYMRLGGERQPNPDYGAAEVKQGDLFILCSDGLWQSVDSKELQVLVSADDTQVAVEQLVKIASERGGSGGDNISAALARFDKGKKKFRLFF
jgi:serine/threonine protein phosphatase PrpC